MMLRFQAPEPIKRTPLGDAIDKATLKLLQEAFIASSDKNVVTSPLGAMILLSLYSTGAGEVTQKQINNYLGGASHTELAESYSGLSRKFSTLNPECLTVANKIYLNQRFTLWDNFSEIARSSYESEVDKINVHAPAEAAGLINKWAETMTRGHIKNAISESDINASTAALLVNVIFFQGHWSVPFKALDTKEKDFHTSSGDVVKKPMMHLLRAFKYTACANIPARMIELPYQEEGFRMIVVLPNEIDGLPAVVEQAAKTGLLDDIFNLRMHDRVDLDMPKFDIENCLDLQDLLSKIGVNAIFSEEAPHIVKHDFVKVTKAIQKAFVKVDEEGAIAGAFTVSGIPQEQFRFQGPKPVERTPLGDAIDKATLQLLQEAFKASSEKNVVTSPLGAMILLSLYNTGAGEVTQKQINNYLGGASHTELAESYSGLSRKFSTLNPECLTVANKIYLNQRFTLWDNFSEIARSSYQSEVDKINVHAPAEAAGLINEWADKMTRGHIKNAISESDINTSTAALLVNVIFFQGHWSVPFKALDTKEKDFHTSNGDVVKKPMMHLLRAFKYTACANIPARMIELPYKEEGFRMIVVLPNEIDGLPTVVEQAAKTGLLDDVFNLRTEDSVDLDMPKFDIENCLDLQNLLSKIGVNAIFSEEAPGIVDNAFVYVTKAIQKAFVKVDEEGAIAGAFTAFIACRTDSVHIPPPPVKFTVDRPFLFMILHEDIILFVGTLSK